LSGGNYVSSTFVDSAGRIYVTTSDRLTRIDDMNGNGWTEFRQPGLKSVVVDQQGRIYFSENNTHTISRMNDMQGNGLVRLGSHGTGVGQFNEPEGMAFDAQGRIYVADETNHSIVRMDDMTGAGWIRYGSYGDSPGQLSLVHDVQVDSLGRIYIADTGNSRIVRIDSMSGEGFVSFGRSPCQNCSPPDVGAFTFEATKAIRVLGSGPTLTYARVLPHVSVGGTYRTSISPSTVTGSGTPQSYGKPD